MHCTGVNNTRRMTERHAKKRTHTTKTHKKGTPPSPAPPCPRLHSRLPLEHSKRGSKKKYQHILIESKKKATLYNKCDTLFGACSSSSETENVLAAFFFPFTYFASAFRDAFGGGDVSSSSSSSSTPSESLASRAS